MAVTLASQMDAITHIFVRTIMLIGLEGWGREGEGRERERQGGIDGPIQTKWFGAMLYMCFFFDNFFSK